MGDRRRERMREYEEARAAYEETKSPEHKRWLLSAMRSRDMNPSDVVRVIDDNIEREKDYDRETEEIKRKLGFKTGFRRKEDKDDG
jgi:hypothetical protein